MPARTLRVIAEIGENHLGDKARAMTMIECAARSGVDFVKFQSYDVNDLNASADEETVRWIRETQLSEEDHVKFKAHAESFKVRFLSTAVNIRWASFLHSMGCSAIKLASLSLANFGLLQFAGNHFEEVFLSTGMGEPDEIARALEAVGDKPHVTLLHCVSEYPTQDHLANLKSILYLQKNFKCAIGYSDHTIGTVACYAAAALGAILIEKHFTLDKTFPGSDHILSADPSEMAQIVYGCRRIQSQLGDFQKSPTETERLRRNSVRTLFNPDDPITARNH